MQGVKTQLGAMHGRFSRNGPAFEGNDNRAGQLEVGPTFLNIVKSLLHA